ncbi:hypothetical protein NE237_026895 [Protea cynaroides]|uniref:Uncharacterized protein n=1 Tax=Protea cynaroides TaxID=273540 RepID=A0A9Q0GP42_9MAGN|nr:hypothetical protein NE237_026895 [Protea cynaroides]
MCHHRRLPKKDETYQIVAVAGEESRTEIKISSSPLLFLPFSSVLLLEEQKSGFFGRGSPEMKMKMKMKAEEMKMKQRERISFTVAFEKVDPAQMVINGSTVASDSQKNSHQLREKKSKQSNSSHSFPVNIPSNNSLLQYSSSKNSNDDLKEDADMVPPHLIIVDRNAYTVFSFCKGNGRSLKGCDLRRVKNSILRMTDFLKT